MSSSNFKLAFGPMSPECVEAVFSYSHEHRIDLGLVVSKNQIDYNGGYVHGWDTPRFMGFIDTMRERYPHSRVTICRDHCGPGFNGIGELSDVYKTVKMDIASGFDLIHFDLCYLKGSEKRRLTETRRLIDYARNLNPYIRFEVGTENPGGCPASHVARLERELDSYSPHWVPSFYVVQTGSMVREDRQVGRFDHESVQKAAELLHSHGIRLKEHNADYLTAAEIACRGTLVDAMNIAPEMGVRQTDYILDQCHKHRIPCDCWMEQCWKSRKWEKWLLVPGGGDTRLCARVAGHYNFHGHDYETIKWMLSFRENVSVIDHLKERIHEYAVHRQALGH